MMVNMIRAEWLKLSRRPLGWILLIVFILQMVFFLSGLFLVVALNDGIFPIQADIAAIAGPAQMEQFRIRMSFPGIFGLVLEQVNGFGGIFAIIFTAGAMGSEYHWGTLRVQLARQPDRTRYLLAKIITLLLIILTGIAITLLIGIVLGLFYGWMLGYMGSINIHDILLLPVGIIRALYIMLPYLMFTTAIAIIGRSVMAGVAGGILLAVIDTSTGLPSLASHIDNPMIKTFLNLLMQQNVNALTLANKRMYGLGVDPLVSARLDPATLPSPLQATIVLGIYSLVFFSYAYILFHRRDIGGAA